MEKVLRLTTLHQRGNDFAYWRTRTPQQRLDAVETLRLQYQRLKHVEPGLQRVCRLVERPPR
jgi:hypothetical protein